MKAVVKVGGKQYLVSEKETLMVDLLPEGTKELDLDALLVIDGDKNPIGVITKTDVVRFENENARTVQKKTDVVADDQSVLSWMTPVIFTVPPEVPVSEIAKRMIKYGVHHIFVRNPKQKSIVGVVSTFDILQQVASFTEEV
jgi:CBS domain-containing protein